MSSSFINNIENIYTCNICSDDIQPNNAISLICNPEKHIFCYECIYDWFDELKKKLKKKNFNYYIQNMCPICLKNGGSLPISNKIDGISSKYCGEKLKTKNSFCKFNGKSIYNGLCHIHFNCNFTKI